MGKELKYDTSYLEGHVSRKELDALAPKVEEAHSLLSGGSGPFNGYLGWMDLPETTGEDLLADIKETARRLRECSRAIVIIGIGGSYLGARAAIETIVPEAVGKSIFFAGHNLCGHHICDLKERLSGMDFSVNVISKSGTTTETAVAFRVIEELLREKYGPGGFPERVVCTTDREKGALKAMAD